MKKNLHKCECCWEKATIWKISKVFGVIPYCDACFRELQMKEKKVWTLEEIREYLSDESKVMMD